MARVWYKASGVAALASHDCRPLRLSCESPSFPLKDHARRPEYYYDRGVAVQLMIHVTQKYLPTFAEFLRGALVCHALFYEDDR